MDKDLSSLEVKSPLPKRNEKGSVVLIVALSLTALLGCAAIVTDIGILYAQKARLQNAVDAAALAGVQNLPRNPYLAEFNAKDYATKNSIGTIETKITGNNSVLSVKASQVAPTYFAKIWGVNSKVLEATSKAQSIPPRSLTGAVPLSIQEHHFVYGQTYTLKVGAGNSAIVGTSYAGWFGALDLGYGSGGGASAYRYDLINGYNGTLTVGQVVNVQTGNLSGPTSEAVTTRISKDTRYPPNTYDNFDRDAPQIIYVPVIRPILINNVVSQVKIVGFAAFFLEGVGGQGIDSYVTGKFIKTLSKNGKATGVSLAELLQTEEQMNNGNATDYGLYTAKLIK